MKVFTHTHDEQLTTSQKYLVNLNFQQKTPYNNKQCTLLHVWFLNSIWFRVLILCIKSLNNRIIIDFCSNIVFVVISRWREEGEHQSSCLNLVILLFPPGNCTSKYCLLVSRRWPQVHLSSLDVQSWDQLHFHLESVPGFLGC